MWTLWLGVIQFSMASASIFNQADVNVTSNIEDEVPSVIFDCNILEYEGVPRHL